MHTTKERENRDANDSRKLTNLSVDVMHSMKQMTETSHNVSDLKLKQTYSSLDVSIVNMKDAHEMESRHA